MTEDEVKTKWCPFARTVFVVADNKGVAAINRGKGGRGDFRCYCLGSLYMAWREISDPQPGGGYCVQAGHFGCSPVRR